MISAGPTVEKLDAVRALTNLSSGKMGYAIAQAAQAQGAEVTLVSGPVALSTPAGVNIINVESARDMLSALERALAQGHVDFLLMAAAVADFRVEQVSVDKLKKEKGLKSIEWVENPVLIQSLAKKYPATLSTLPYIYY